MLHIASEPDGDGDWTTITRNRHRRPRRRHGELSAPTPRQTSKEDTPTPRPPVRDVDALNVQYGTAWEKWVSSTTRAKLREILEGRGVGGASGSREHRLLRVEKVICLGLGTPSADESGRGGGNESVMMQLCCLIDLAQSLNPKGNGVAGNTTGPGQALSNRPTGLPVWPAGGKRMDSTTSMDGEKRGPEILAADPVFNATDHCFLSDLGVSTVGHDDVWGMIDETTVVVAPHFPVGNAQPSFFLGTAVVSGEGGSLVGNGKLRETGEKEWPGERSEWGPVVLVCNDSIGIAEDEVRDDNGRKRATAERGIDCSETGELTVVDGARHILRNYEAWPFPIPDWQSRKKRSDEEDVEGLHRAFGGMVVYIRNDPRIEHTDESDADNAEPHDDGG